MLLGASLELVGALLPWQELAGSVGIYRLLTGVDSWPLSLRLGQVLGASGPIILSFVAAIGLLRTDGDELLWGGGVVAMGALSLFQLASQSIGLGDSSLRLGFYLGALGRLFAVLAAILALVQIWRTFRSEAAPPPPMPA